MSALYDIINILPFSLLTVMLSGVHAGMPEGSIFGYALCLTVSVWIMLLPNMERKNRLRSIGAVLVFIIGLALVAGKENRQLFAEKYIWTVRIALISAGAVTAGILMNRNIRIKRAATAALILCCIAGTILGRAISKEVFSLICFILLVRTAEELQLKWKKSGSTDIKEHITRISPIFLAVCLIVHAVPAPDKPYDWQFAKAVYRYTVSCFSRLYGSVTHPSDDYGNIGFSDKGSFLTGLNGNDDEILIITAGNATIKELRLIGCIGSDFSGREWTFDTGKESFYRMTDTMETYCAVRKCKELSFSDLLQKTDLNCESLFYNTRYIFSPAKIKLEVTKDKNSGKNGRGSGITEKNGSIVSERRLSYRDSYAVSCYLFNYIDPDIGVLLGNASPISEDEWLQAERSEGVLDIEGYSFEDYRRYRETVYERYCRSYGVSEAAGKIISEIKSSSSSRYEAAKKLEAYLRQLEYSTDCGPLPDSVTDASGFLDHFLFTSQKGYCMHFATAFVIMANEMGIPCRYVQGFNVRKDSGGNMIVRQSSAHAWPEVYFDNAGWITFEPTPGFSVPAGWKARGKDAYEFNMDLSVPEIAAVQDKNADEPEDITEEKAAIDPLIIMIPSLAAVGFLILFYIISRLVTHGKFKRMSRRDKLRYLTQQNLRFLGYLGFRMKKDETLSEFSDRISASDSQELKGQLGFIPIYEAALYSDREITEEDISSAENIYDTLRTLAKKSRLGAVLMLITKKQ